MQSVGRLIDYYDLKDGDIEKNDPIMIKLMKKSVMEYDKMGTMMIKGEDVFTELIMMEIELDTRLELEYKNTKLSSNETSEIDNVSVFSKSGLHIKDQYKYLLRAFIKRINNINLLTERYIKLRERIDSMIQVLNGDLNENEIPPKLEISFNNTSKYNKEFIERNRNLFL